MRNNSENPHVKRSGFTLSLLAREEVTTWLYSHWTFVVRETETWWNIATRSMSLAFKINILALTWRLFSINASASIWHFSSSRRLLSCDNTQFHWHYLLSTCDSAPKLHVVDFNETISEKYKAKVSKNRISSPMRCVWCYNSMGMLCKSVSYLRKHTVSLTLGVPGSECLLIPVHSRAVADVMVSMYRTEHINVLKSPKPIWTYINKFWCSGNPCHSNSAVVQSVFVIRRLSYNHADSLIPFRW